MYQINMNSKSVQNKIWHEKGLLIQLLHQNLCLNLFISQSSNLPKHTYTHILNSIMTHN